MNKPLVSVITITRNRGALIKRCIDSVLNQTYPSIEHIIVDGASTDNTEEVVSSYNDSRIRFVKLESNWPIVQTINYGVELSKGDYITFLDSDDEYLPEKVEKQLKLMETLPDDYGMVYCWMTSYDTKTGNVLYFHNPQLRGFVGDDVVEKQVVSGTPTFLFKRNAFLENGGWRDDIGIISDWEMAARFCQKWKVDYVPESLVNVYENHGALRMSNKAYYDDWYLKTIKFRQHFLDCFSNVFARYPKKSISHLRVLLECYIALKRWRDAFNCYMKILQIGCSIKNIVYPIRSITRLYRCSRK